MAGSQNGEGPWSRVSVIIPARDEAAHIADTVGAVRNQAEAGIELEILVVDDGSSDGTAEAAESAGARVLRLDPDESPVRPAGARNRGVAATTGDPIIFLDADCRPAPGWLAALLEAHRAGAVVVGGAVGLPEGLGIIARCDYYCSWYLIHPGRPAGPVPHHPPPNLSVRREAFLSTEGFSERKPLSYTNEERHWQAALARRGVEIFFEPRAAVLHRHDSGFRNLLRRHFRWAYTALESKGETGASRLAWLYRRPVLLMASALPLIPIHSAFILYCWLRAGRYEPLLMLPAILASRCAYMAGLVTGGVRWLRR